jgi:energy-coupling factor transporter ATP-binding protein EcfA2
MPLFKQNPIGSIWHRWEPHIHTPLTALINQYKTATIEDFCTAVEQCQPIIKALGVTDYLSIHSYEEIIASKSKGRLPDVHFIFPNVEIRLDVGTVKGSAINAHLMFSPEDPDHVSEIKRFLGQIVFRYNDAYNCTRDDLIRLGKRIRPGVPDNKAYEEGVNQFKISIDDLLDKLSTNDWAKKNCLIGVASNNGDGTSGLQTPDGAFEALRKKIQAAAHTIFSGNPKDRDFWLGRGIDSVEKLEQEHNGIKPCLIGSDAHALDKVGRPDQDRYCWIKGDLVFESLLQACIEPANRVYVGSESPYNANSSQTISNISVQSSEWLKPKEIHLNPGLIAIIGARGSGKTALADLIASGAYAINQNVSDRSFITRAQPFFDGSSVEIKWGDGDCTKSSLLIDEMDQFELPRVQYLSQQFVDELCSSEGLADSLVAEVKRVIFTAHPIHDRDGASTFEELYQLRCQEAIDHRSTCENELDSVARDLLMEMQLKQEVPNLEKQKSELEKQLQNDQKFRGQLVRPGQEERITRHQQIEKALQIRRNEFEQIQKQLRALKSLQADIDAFRKRDGLSFVQKLKQARIDADLTAAEWTKFTPTISTQADDLLTSRIKSKETESTSISGYQITQESFLKSYPKGLDAQVDLSKQTISTLQMESERLNQLIGIDKQNTEKFKKISEKIVNTQKQIANLTERLRRAGEADKRIEELRSRRRETYRQVFTAIAELETELSTLYSPLKEALKSSEGTLGKLKFVIRRNVDLKSWTETGEALLDLRKEGQFRGQKTLYKVVETELLKILESGTPEEVGNSIDEFIHKYTEAFRQHRLESMDQKEWHSAVSTWLKSTKHIQVEYGLQYDGVDIERLSPGTRGIVLLLLYLAVDSEDDRPLIIDQPEENLDPQSVYEELVTRFREAKNRRQIIIVTHNANLVVNTDVDQVIVASAGEHRPGQLPMITYQSGGLENSQIRNSVCSILEGGEKAFRDRAKRLRLKFAKAKN